MATFDLSAQEGSSLSALFGQSQVCEQRARRFAADLPKWPARSAGEFVSRGKTSEDFAQIVDEYAPELCRPPIFQQGYVREIGKYGLAHEAGVDLFGFDDGKGRGIAGYAEQVRIIQKWLSFHTWTEVKKPREEHGQEDDAQFGAWEMLTIDEVAAVYGELIEGFRNWLRLYPCKFSSLLDKDSDGDVAMADHNKPIFRKARDVAKAAAILDTFCERFLRVACIRGMQASCMLFRRRDSGKERKGDSRRHAEARYAAKGVPVNDTHYNWDDVIRRKQNPSTPHAITLKTIAAKSREQGFGQWQSFSAADLVDRVDPNDLLQSCTAIQGTGKNLRIQLNVDMTEDKERGVCEGTGWPLGDAPGDDAVTVASLDPTAPTSVADLHGSKLIFAQAFEFYAAHHSLWRLWAREHTVDRVDELERAPGGLTWFHHFRETIAEGDYIRAFDEMQSLKTKNCRADPPLGVSTSPSPPADVQYAPLGDGFTADRWQNFCLEKDAEGKNRLVPAQNVKDFNTSCTFVHDGKSEEGRLDEFAKMLSTYFMLDPGLSHLRTALDLQTDLTSDEDHALIALKARVEAMTLLIQRDRQLNVLDSCFNNKAMYAKFCERIEENVERERERECHIRQQDGDERSDALILQSVVKQAISHHAEAALRHGKNFAMLHFLQGKRRHYLRCESALKQKISCEKNRSKKVEFEELLQRVQQERGFNDRSASGWSPSGLDHDVRLLQDKLRSRRYGNRFSLDEVRRGASKRNSMQLRQVEDPEKTRQQREQAYLRTYDLQPSDQMVDWCIAFKRATRDNRVNHFLSQPSVPGRILSTKRRQIIASLAYDTTRLIGIGGLVACKDEDGRGFNSSNGHVGQDRDLLAAIQETGIVAFACLRKSRAVMEGQIITPATVEQSRSGSAGQANRLHEIRKGKAFVYDEDGKMQRIDLYKLYVQSEASREVFAMLWSCVKDGKRRYRRQLQCSKSIENDASTKLTMAYMKFQDAIASGVTTPVAIANCTARPERNFLQALLATPMPRQQRLKNIFGTICDLYKGKKISLDGLSSVRDQLFAEMPSLLACEKKPFDDLVDDVKELANDRLARRAVITAFLEDEVVFDVLKRCENHLGADYEDYKVLKRCPDGPHRGRIDIDMMHLNHVEALHFELGTMRTEQERNPDMARLFADGQEKLETLQDHLILWGPRPTLRAIDVRHHPIYPEFLSMVFKDPAKAEVMIAESNYDFKRPDDKSPESWTRERIADAHAHLDAPDGLFENHASGDDKPFVALEMAHRYNDHPAGRDEYGSPQYCDNTEKPRYRMGGDQLCDSPLVICNDVDSEMEIDDYVEGGVSDVDDDEQPFAIPQRSSGNRSFCAKALFAGCGRFDHEELTMTPEEIDECMIWEQQGFSDDEDARSVEFPDHNAPEVAPFCNNLLDVNARKFHLQRLNRKARGKCLQKPPKGSDVPSAKWEELVLANAQQLAWEQEVLPEWDAKSKEWSNLPSKFIQVNANGAIMPVEEARRDNKHMCYFLEGEFLRSKHRDGSAIWEPVPEEWTFNAAGEGGVETWSNAAECIDGGFVKLTDAGLEREERYKDQMALAASDRNGSGSGRGGKRKRVTQMEMSKKARGASAATR